MSADLGPGRAAHQPLDWLKLVMLAVSVVLLAPGSARAAAEGAAECVRQRPSFDGTRDLRYVRVGGDGHAYIHPTHPSLCSSPDVGNCEGKAYLLPHDTVAVGSVCGSYSFIQYIGEARITYGWVESARLTEERPNTSPAPADSAPDSPEMHFRFKLSKGRGVPVCEAYLQRLNQTVYVSPPYCDRPESDSVPGFAKLHRVPLPISDVNRLLPQVDNFSHPLTPTPERSWVIQPDGTRKLQPSWPPALIRELAVPIWQYNPAVDIDNDGHPANLVVWRNDTSPGPVCGQELTTRPVVVRSAQFAYFLTPGNATIDVARTKATFERPPGAVPDPNHRGFNPIGLAVGIFEYRSRYYFDTFYSATDLQGQAVSEDTLGVFQRLNGGTQELCRYDMSEDEP
jgi:hypothetical protein